MTPTTIALATTAAAAASTAWWVAPAVVAATIAATMAMITLLVNGRRTRVDRQRVLLAAAFGDVAGYREFVYIVRRRRHDQPEAERVRISTELSEVQRKLNQHSAVLKVEAPRVAVAFDALLRVTRQVAGTAIREGWNTAPITEDSNIHVDIDLSAIAPLEVAYLDEVGDHLSATPAFARRWRRARAASVARWRDRRTQAPGVAVTAGSAP